MHIIQETLDDLLRDVFQRLMQSPVHVQSSKGRNRELAGALLEIRKPTARLSRTESKGTVFSCLGETLWYLARSNRLDFIEYYLPTYKEFSDDGRTVYGAYGPRLFRMRRKVDQIDSVIRLLKRKPRTRQAVIQLFNAEDILSPHEDIPCTCTLQFLIRADRLHMLTHMRSNDAFLGLPHDVFAFTFLQEIIARSVGVELGLYKHAVGSLHLYDKHQAKAKQFLNEAWQATISMPDMPQGNPWPNIAKLISAESRIRRGSEVNISSFRLPNYWADLVRLLQIYAASRKNRDVAKIRSEMTSNVYNAYIDKRAAKSKSSKR